MLKWNKTISRPERQDTIITDEEQKNMNPCFHQSQEIVQTDGIGDRCWA